VREPLSEELIELVVRRLRVVAEPNRIALLAELNDGEASVEELADRLGLPHQNASRHLVLLWREGILARRSERRKTLYRVADWGAWWVIEQVAGSLRQASHSTN
jgi:DNA-binding transcriptional ArsR family regulator